MRALKFQANLRSDRKRPVRRKKSNTQNLSATSSNTVNALDGGVLVSTALLASLGIVMSYSATAPLALENPLPPLFLDHLAGLGLGLALAGICSKLSLRFSRANKLITMPGVQKPHCEPCLSTIACCTGCS